MPSLTANQLRIAVLQHRDIYLEKQILDISVRNANHNIFNTIYFVFFREMLT